MSKTMSKQSLRSKPLALAIGASLGLSAIGAQAAPLFVATDLAAGYALASADDGKKPAEGACGGEGGCGANMGGGSADKKADAKPADDKAAPKPAPAPKQ